MIKFKENEGARGCFRMKVYRKNKLVETYEDNNLIVNGAKAAMAALIAGNGKKKNVAQIAFGTSGNPPVPDDTGITSQFAKDITGAAFPETGQVEFSWDLFTNEANGKAIMEFGLLMADGTLFARKIRQTTQIRIRTSGWNREY